MKTLNGELATHAYVMMVTYAYVTMVTHAYVMVAYI